MGTEIQIQKVEHIQGWPLTVVRGEKQPLIEDEELGRKLGFDRPRRIRELIARIFNDSELCRTVRQSRGRSATVFYLTRSQALKVIMRSETPTADRVQDEIIAVYEAWLDGHLGPRKGTERLEYRTEFLKLLSDPVVVQQFRRLLSGPASKAELDGLAYVIEEAAEARHVSFNIVHGAIRKRAARAVHEARRAFRGAGAVRAR